MAATRSPAPTCRVPLKKPRHWSQATLLHQTAESPLRGLSIIL